VYLIPGHVLSPLVAPVTGGLLLPPSAGSRTPGAPAVKGNRLALTSGVGLSRHACSQNDGILIEDILSNPDAVISPSVTGRIWSLLKKLQLVSQPVGDFYNIEQAIRIGSPKTREKLVVNNLT
jgi:hypothetical protein